MVKHKPMFDYDPKRWMVYLSYEGEKPREDKSLVIRVLNHFEVKYSFTWSPYHPPYTIGLEKIIRTDKDGRSYTVYKPYSLSSDYAGDRRVLDVLSAYGVIPCPGEEAEKLMGKKDE
ncbi:MAG: hypothetical protein V1866_05200 [archaeon]